MPRLLEREEELGSLAEAVSRAVDGHGSLVLIAGEPGIGKTSIVRAMRADLPPGVAAVSGGCEALSVPVPLAPLRELFREPDPDLVSGAGPDPMTLATSVRAFLDDHAPVVAIIEDGHWADPLTLDVVRVLARRIEETRAVIVMTYRDDEVGANRPLRLLLGDLATNPAVRRLSLRPLSDVAIETLATGSGLDVGRLRGATGGNPFLVVETIAAGGRLPASVRDAALSRVGRLSLGAREVVDAAAVIGPRFDTGLLRAVVGREDAPVEEALDRGVLVADGNELGFRHDLIREAIEQSVSPARRAELHARVFAALSAQPRGIDSARLAHHAEFGGLDDAAATHAAIAAAEAERVGALREACLQAERALRLGHGLHPRDRFELLVQYSRTANFANPRLEAAVDAAQRAVALADELRDGAARGRALMVLAYASWSLERVLEAREAARQAVAAFAPAADLASQAWAEATLCRIEATSFDPRDAIRTADRAQRLAERADLPEVCVDVMISDGLARGHLGSAEALDVLDEALREATDHGYTIRRVRAFVNLMTVAVALREHRRVDAITAEALPLLEELGVSRLPIMAIRWTSARSLLDRGRWRAALEVADQREPWWQGEFPVACAMSGLIHARQGDPRAAELLDEGWRTLTALVPSETARHGMVRLSRVEAAWLRGDHAAARAELTAALEADAVRRFARSGGELALWGARLGLRMEVPEGAPSAVALEVEGDWRRAVAAWSRLDAPYEAALAALSGDDPAARRAIATLHRLGAAAAARAFSRERRAAGQRPPRGPRRSTLAHPAGLTRREQEVLTALDSGASNAQIAVSLHLSERTVAHHVAAILAKLDAANRHAAVEQARRRGLLPRPA